MRTPFVYPSDVIKTLYSSLTPVYFHVFRFIFNPLWSSGTFADTLCIEMYSKKTQHKVEKCFVIYKRVEHMVRIIDVYMSISLLVYCITFLKDVHISTHPEAITQFTYNRTLKLIRTFPRLPTNT